MENCDAEQSGIELPPANTIHWIVRAEAEQIIAKHLRLCPFAELQIERRLRAVETNFAKLVGAMIGSGALGGALGAATTKLLGQ